AVIVATDAKSIQAACQAHHIDSVMTSPKLVSGTDRVWQVAKSQRRRYVLNVQGDEPFVSVTDLKNLMRTLENKPEFDLATLVFRSTDEHDFRIPSVVKAVRGATGTALYFSRASVPFTRDAVDEPLAF